MKDKGQIFIWEIFLFHQELMNFKYKQSQFHVHLRMGETSFKNTAQ
jgi:hypothetical protein